MEFIRRTRSSLTHRIRSLDDRSLENTPESGFSLPTSRERSRLSFVGDAGNKHFATEMFLSAIFQQNDNLAACVSRCNRAESALDDHSPKVRAAAIRVVLGLIGAVLATPKLKAVLSDKEPAVVLAAAHSLFLLGDRQEAYEIDYEVLMGERNSADGFVKSQMNDLHDPKGGGHDGF